MMSPKHSRQTSADSDADQVDQVLELQALVIEKDEAHKRVLADYQNLLHRSAEEKKVLIASANRTMMSDLLPTLDHLELAMTHFEDSSLQMIVSGLRKTLENYGLRRIETVGLKFDPHTMEAVDTASGEEGIVVREQRAGYRLQDTVLRHAEVVVGK